MLDLIVLFTVFVGLVGLLALVHQWQVSRGSAQSHASNMQLLNEWLEAHKLELPGVQCLLSILNRKLQEMESEVSLFPHVSLVLFEAGVVLPLSPLAGWVGFFKLVGRMQKFKMNCSYHSSIV